MTDIFTMNRQADLLDQQGDDVAAGVMRDGATRLTEEIGAHKFTANQREELRAAIAAQSKEMDSLREDAERLDWLVKNEYQVWEVNGRYSIHEVTEHHAITTAFDSAREAIDAVKEIK